MSAEESKVDLSGVDLSGVVVDVSGGVQEPPKVAKKDVLLADILVEYLGAESKEVELSSRQVLMVRRLLQHDSVNLGNIEKLVGTILADKKINAKDIPELIQLVKELYKFFKQLFLRRISADDCGAVLKAIVHVLITYRLDEDTEAKDALKKDLSEILDSAVAASVELIELKEKLPKLSLLKSLLICF